MLSDVNVACVTTAITPSTITVFSPLTELNPTPVMLAASPSISGFGLTDANRTGGGVSTSTVACPVTPSEVADTVVLPGVPPVTSPLASTVAMEASAVVHVTVLPVSGRPPASWGVAVIWTLSVEMTTAGSGITTTDATSVSTVIVAEPLCPSDVAVIVASPMDSPVTLPLVLTEAIAASDVLQATVRPVRVLPDAPSVVADICTLAPTTTLDSVEVTITLATGSGVAGSPPPGSLPLEQPRAKLTTSVMRDRPRPDDIGTSGG